MSFKCMPVTLFTLFVPIFLCCNQVPVQPNIEAKHGIYLVGKVVDNNNMPMSGIPVELAILQVQKLTDTNGVFLIADTIEPPSLKNHPDTLNILIQNHNLKASIINCYKDSLQNIVIAKQEIISSFITQSFTQESVAVILVSNDTILKDTIKNQLQVNPNNSSITGSIYCLNSKNAIPYIAYLVAYNEKSVIVGKSFQLILQNLMDI